MKKTPFLTCCLLLIAVFSFAQGRVEALPKSSDNTLLYVALGVGAAGIAGGVYYYSQRKKK